MAFGTWLLAHRKRANLSATTLAELAGISTAYLCDLEKCRRRPSIDVCIALCEWLHVPTDVGLFYAGFPSVDLASVRATDQQIERALAVFRRSVLLAPTDE